MYPRCIKRKGYGAVYLQYEESSFQSAKAVPPELPCAPFNLGSRTGQSLGELAFQARSSSSH